jgi:outer membrane protein TolC
LALVHYKLRDSLRQSGLYKDALLPKATQVLNATQSAYEGGKADFLSLIDAQRVLLNFQLAYYRHNADFHQRLSELQSLLGEVKEFEGSIFAK